MSEADEAWPAVVAAFARYGKRVHPRLTPAEVKKAQGAALLVRGGGLEDEPAELEKEPIVAPVSVELDLPEDSAMEPDLLNPHKLAVRPPYRRANRCVQLIHP